MVTAQELVLAFLPYIVNPVPISAVAFAMMVYRELHPNWRESLVYGLYDLLLFSLGIGLLLILLVRILGPGHPTHA